MDDVLDSTYRLEGNSYSSLYVHVPKCYPSTRVYYPLGYHVCSNWLCHSTHHYVVLTSSVLQEVAMTIDEVFKEASQGCQVEGCNCKGEVVLSPHCHPGSPTVVSVDPSQGVLKIVCSVCDTGVLTIKHIMSN